MNLRARLQDAHPQALPYNDREFLIENTQDVGLTERRDIPSKGLRNYRASIDWLDAKGFSFERVKSNIITIFRVGPPKAVQREVERLLLSAAERRLTNITLGIDLMDAGPRHACKLWLRFQGLEVQTSYFGTEPGLKVIWSLPPEVHTL